jgi:Neutral/alkaline non-lysosomal ceramidase, N-terminal
MKKLKWSAFGLAILFVGLFLGAFAYYNSRDRHPDYTLNLNVVAPTHDVNYKVGFAAIKITPNLPDRWFDKNKDATYDPDHGDTYQDINKNGHLDAVWLAGFQNSRPANGIHDNLWARAMLIDDGHTRMVIVAVDLIAFSHKNVVNVRQRIPKKWGITYSIICATHNHEAPDMIGMWGDSYLKSGVDDNYEQMVEDKVVEAIGAALKNARMAKLRVAQDLTGAQNLTTDTRKPIVKDDGLYMLQANDATTDSTLGTLVVWGNHPETLWSDNLLVTSDFPHYLREAVEKGVYDGQKLVKKGVGGTVVYATGCVGGLMTTSPSVTIKDPFAANKNYQNPSFEKAEAEGKTLALLILNALDNTEPVQKGIGLVAKTFELPLQNKAFKAAIALGVLDAGYSNWGHFRTEVAAWQMGDVSFITVPGEIYPEIVNGGVETPSEADFGLKSAVETPALRSLMRGKYKFVIGLANDELGYIIPKSEWDTEPPYLYGEKEQLYGEINSVGPDAAPIIHKELATLLQKLNK